MSGFADLFWAVADHEQRLKKLEEPKMAAHSDRDFYARGFEAGRKVMRGACIAECENVVAGAEKSADVLTEAGEHDLAKYLRYVADGATGCAARIKDLP